MIESLDRILVLIPVRNEATTIGSVIRALQAQGLNQIRVIDNGSSDSSAVVAANAGADVLFEPKPGYGQACWRGLQAIPDPIEWILFCDGDGSDDLSQLIELLAQRQQYDLILGDRRTTPAGKAALTSVQNFGNGLATRLIGLGWGYRYGDLGPLRLIRRSALAQMQMRDRGMGWTVEMQLRAVDLGLRICELPVNYWPRQGGKSKISGTLSGSIRAGLVILTTLSYWYMRRIARQISRQISEKITKPIPKILWISSLLILTGCIWLIPQGNFSEARTLPQFWLGVSIIGSGFMLSGMLRSINAVWFWGVAILARLLLLPMYPGDDIWRYIWEGYIQTLGFSPYELAPDAVVLRPYRTDWWPQINHLNVSAIYPPIAQLGFRFLAAISPTVLLFKLAFVLADLGVCWLLSRRFGYVNTLVYAWNPLVLYAFAGGGHYDSWFILPLVVAWLGWETWGRAMPTLSRWRWAAVWTGISVAVKWISLPVLGFLAWQIVKGQVKGQQAEGQAVAQRWQQAGLVVLCGMVPLLLSALPFCHFNHCPLIPTDSTFVRNGRSAELVPYLSVGLLTGVGKALGEVNWVSDWANWTTHWATANWVYGLPLGLIGLGLMSKTQRFLVFTESYLFTLLILSPIIHAWYFTWIVPFAVASRNLGTRLVSLSAFIYFVLPHRLALRNPDWFLTNRERLILWVPFVLGWFWTVRSAGMTSPSILPSRSDKS